MIQPTLEAYQGRPPEKPARRAPQPQERHAPSAWDGSRCAFCGFFWNGHPEHIKAAAVGLIP